MWQATLDRKTNTVSWSAWSHISIAFRRLPNITSNGQILSNITFHITPFITAPLKLSFGAFACLAVEKTFLCSLAASEEKGKKKARIDLHTQQAIYKGFLFSFLSLLIPSSILFYSEVINTLKKRGVGEKFSTITGERHCDEKFVDFPCSPRLWSNYACVELRKNGMSSQHRKGRGKKNFGDLVGMRIGRESKNRKM